MYKTIIEGKQAVFFDLDGTIIDSALYWQRAFNNVARRHGLKGVHSSVVHRGLSTENAAKLAVDHAETKPEKSPELIAQEVDEEYLRIFKEAPLVERDGFWDLVFELKENKKLPVAIVSNSRRNVVDTVFDAMDVNPEGFDLIITRDDVKHGKPHPEIYRKAARELKVSARKTLVFEDSLTGMEAANKAGAEVIIVWSGVVPAPEYKAKSKLLISDFKELSGRLDHSYREYAEHLLEREETSS